MRLIFRGGNIEGLTVLAFEYFITSSRARSEVFCAALLHLSHHEWISISFAATKP